MRKRNDSISPNKQEELAQNGTEVRDEESLAQVIGEAGLNIVRVVASIPNMVRIPDLNLTPVEARRLLPPPPPPPSPASSGNDLGKELSPSNVLDRYLNHR